MWCEFASLSLIIWQNLISTICNYRLSWYFGCSSRVLVDQSGVKLQLAKPDAGRVHGSVQRQKLRLLGNRPNHHGQRKQPEGNLLLFERIHLTWEKCTLWFPVPGSSFAEPSCRVSVWISRRAAPCQRLRTPKWYGYWRHLNNPSLACIDCVALAIPILLKLTLPL